MRFYKPIKKIERVDIVVRQYYKFFILQYEITSRKFKCTGSWPTSIPWSSETVESLRKWDTETGAFCKSRLQGLNLIECSSRPVNDIVTPFSLCCFIIVLKVACCRMVVESYLDIMTYVSLHFFGVCVGGYEIFQWLTCCMVILCTTSFVMQSRENDPYF